MTISATLRRLGACSPALRWSRRIEREQPGTTLAQLWAASPRGAWLLWMVWRLRESAPTADRERFQAIHARAASAWARASKRDDPAAVREAVLPADFEVLAAAFERAAGAPA